jgi:hypothetical protein
MGTTAGQFRPNVSWCSLGQRPVSAHDPGIWRRRGSRSPWPQPAQWRGRHRLTDSIQATRSTPRASVWLRPLAWRGDGGRILLWWWGDVEANGMLRSDSPLPGDGALVATVNSRWSLQHKADEEDVRGKLVRRKGARRCGSTRGIGAQARNPVWAAHGVSRGLKGGWHVSPSHCARFEVYQTGSKTVQEVEFKFINPFKLWLIKKWPSWAQFFWNKVWFWSFLRGGQLSL